MDPEEEEEVDTRPKVKKKHIVLPDERISLKSPRLVAAMKSSGVSLDELRPVAESDIVKNVKLTEIAHRRREAFATQQAMVLDLVLKTREGIIESNEAQAARRLKSSESGVPAAGGGGDGDDLSTMLQQEQEHMQRILEASQRRIASEKKGLQEAEALAKRRMDDQKRLDEQMAMRQAEQKAEVARRRAGNLEKQLEREAMHTQNELDSLESGRLADQQRNEREVAIERARKKRERKSREKSLHFAREQDQKRQAMLGRQAAKEEKMALINIETAAKLRDVEIKRREKVFEQQKKIKLENKLRNNENEKRRKERYAMDQKRVLQKEVEIKQHLEAVDRRLASVEMEKTTTLRRKREAEEQMEAERAAKLSELERSRVMSEGDLVGKAEAKEAAIGRALRRREQQMEIRAEESRLKFDGKLRHVARMHRKQDHEMDTAKGRIMEKDRKVEVKNEQKERMKDERRRMAQQFFVQQRQLRDEADRSRMRANSATPTSGMTAGQQREAMRRLSDLGDKGVPDQAFWKK